MTTVNDRNWKVLIRPNRPVVQAGYDARRKAKLTVEPLERGYGTTLGNALRRVLLSSLQGTAIIGVQIDGVVHEFSAIPGVREDVTTVVLNLKQVAVFMESDTPKRMVLRAKGPGEVKAGQIETSGDVKILNPDHVLCTLDGGAEVRMEFTVATGKGYQQLMCIARMMRRSDTFRSMQSFHRCGASATRSRIPAKALFSTMTS